jgi:hypothetical protein
MKTSELTIGSVYSYKKGKYGSPDPVLVLDTKLWTTGEVWRAGVKRYEIDEARPGLRARDASYSANAVGIPVLKIGGGYGLSYSFVSGPQKIVESASTLLLRAAELLDPLEDIKGDHPRDRHPVNRVSVSATQQDGEKIKVEVYLVLVAPQTIKEGWAYHLTRAIEEAERTAVYRQQEMERDSAAQAMNQDVKKRLDALLGEAPNAFNPAVRGDIHRKRGVTGDFIVSEETFLKLLALAEGSGE